MTTRFFGVPDFVHALRIRGCNTYGRRHQGDCLGHRIQKTLRIALADLQALAFLSVTILREIKQGTPNQYVIRRENNNERHRHERGGAMGDVQPGAESIKLETFVKLTQCFGLVPQDQAKSIYRNVSGREM